MRNSRWDYFQITPGRAWLITEKAEDRGSQRCMHLYLSLLFTNDVLDAVAYTANFAYFSHLNFHHLSKKISTELKDIPLDSVMPKLTYYWNEFSRLRNKIYSMYEYMVRNT